MDPRQDGAELGGQPRAGGRVLGVAQQAARQRLALEAVHQEERRAQHRGVGAAPVDARHRHAGPGGGAQHAELERAVGLADAAVRIAAQHQRQPRGGAAPELDVERPQLARGAPCEAVQRAHPHLAGRERGLRGHEVAQARRHLALGEGRGGPRARISHALAQRTARKPSSGSG